MSKHELREWALFFFVITLCIGLIMSVCYAIWGPHYPPAKFDPRTEFVQQCQFKDGVPDVHNNLWTCEGATQ